MHELIEVCRVYDGTKPFIDHENTVSKIKSCLYAQKDLLEIELRGHKKRLVTLQADQKTDPALVNKAKNAVEDSKKKILANKFARSSATFVESVPLKNFIDNPEFQALGNPAFDPLAKAKENTIRKGYVEVVGKSDKPLYFKQEEYRQCISFFVTEEKFPAKAGIKEYATNTWSEVPK